MTGACADDHGNYVPNSDEQVETPIWNVIVDADSIWTYSCGGCHGSLRPTLNGNRLDFQLVLLHLHLDW